MDIDEGAVAHDFALGRMDEPHATHISGELIDFVKGAHAKFQSGQAVVGLAQIQEQEFVSGSRRKFMFLDVYATNPVTLALQFLYQVPTDETSGSAH
jgi:hypothetical protein